MSPYFTIMIDETTDIANIEQVVLVFRWVNNELSVHEEFIDLYQTKTLQLYPSSLVQIIKDVMLWLNLKIVFSAKYLTRCTPARLVY